MQWPQQLDQAFFEKQNKISKNLLHCEALQERQNQEILLTDFLQAESLINHRLQTDGASDTLYLQHLAHKRGTINVCCG